MEIPIDNKKRKRKLLFYKKLCHNLRTKTILKYYGYVGINCEITMKSDKIIIKTASANFHDQLGRTKPGVGEKSYFH